jgi:tetratricopeptide (TPR) repeat protein
MPFLTSRRILSPQENRAKIERHAKKAIALALQGHWQEAITANRSILELFPEDVETYNRLGRALMEVGEYTPAKEAYKHALELDPHNNIAKKNLDRLAHVRGKARKGDPPKVVVDIFVEETGKARVVKLIHLAPKEVLAQMAPGGEITLYIEGQRLLVKNGRGEYLGEVEPKYGLRLARLTAAGNRYIAAINSLEENEVKVIIREVYQHPSQAGHPSFPLREREGFRPYVRETLLRHRLEDEELSDEADETAEAEREGFTVADFDDSSGAEEERKSWPE